MGCCLSHEEKEKKLINNEIERFIKMEQKKMYTELKLLLLGTGESGKSTFIKQMRIIHQNGFTDKEKKNYIKFIFYHIFTAMQSMIKAMYFFNIEYNCPQIMGCLETIKNVDANVATLDSLNVYALKKLWAFDGIKQCYLRRNQYQLSDSTEYFFSNIDRLSSPNYIPTEQDMLRVRAETLGVEEHSFPTDKCTLKIVDVGGQRTRRDKWLHCFDNVASLIFLVAISEYDQVLYECENTNRMDESKALFGTIIKSSWFQNSSIILLLNKKDIFEEKIMYSHLEDYFPEYDGPQKDAIAAREFILHMFLDLNPDSEKMIYHHFTCATGTGESGKTTFVKQMRIINTEGFSVKERQGFITIIYQNMLTSMHDMINGMDLLKINYDIPEIMDCVRVIKHIDANSSTLDDITVKSLRTLWAFDGIQESYRQRRRYQLLDSTEYFFNNIDRVSTENYLPIDEDILKARVETKGIQEYDFRSKNYNIRIIDIPGQRSDRNKWLDLFDKCNAMIFIAAISEYDQLLREVDNVNRLEESIYLFNTMINHHVFVNKPNILFLNKTDLLKDKIETSNLVDYFPEFEGQPRDLMAAKLFIENLFVGKKKDSNGALYPFFTCATDTENIRYVFDIARSWIIRDNLRDSILI